MHWINWLLVSLLGLQILYGFSIIDKPREKVDPFGALFNAMICGLLIAGIIIFNG